MSINDLKKEVYDGNMALVKYGLVILTWGNVSAIDREKGIVVIKPRGIDYELLTPDDMSVTDLDGNPDLNNRYLPSVDLDIHLEIYRNFKDVQAVAHTHSAYATAWAQACEPIPVYGTTHADHFYGAVPCTRHLKPEEIAEGYELNIGKVIVEAFKGINPMQMCGVLTAGHGPFTWGDSVKSSIEHSLILDELAKMALLTRTVNPNSALLPKEVLDKHYLRKYGENAYFYQDK